MFPLENNHRTEKDSQNKRAYSSAVEPRTHNPLVPGSNPGGPKISPFRYRNLALPLLRSYFTGKNLEEVRVPTLVDSGAMEPFLDCLALQKQQNKKYLPTSPEFALKKSMATIPINAAGVYAIAPAFRDERLSDLHEIEFTMVEWYIKKTKYREFYKQIQEILSVLANNLNDYRPPKSILSLSVQEAFSRAFPKFFAKKELSPFSDTNLYRELLLKSKVICSYAFPKNGQKEIHIHEKNFCTNAFFCLMDEVVMPFLSKQAELICLYDFPEFSRGMAQLDQNGWAQRIEFYFRNLEIANGYCEIDSAIDLQNIWNLNNQIRKNMGKEIHPIDHTLLELTHLMKDVAGIAMGLERVLMAGLGIKKISQFNLT